VSATIGRVDLAAAAYRGFEGFGLLRFEAEPAAVGPAVIGRLVETYPRFTMFAADAETVAGGWGLRGEIAVFVDRRFAGASTPGEVAGRAVDAGAGVDRQSGDYRMYAAVLIAHRSSPDDPGLARTSASLVGSIERSFARGRHLLRGFTVVNPQDGAAFVRGLWTWELRDDLSLQASGGWFAGEGTDTIFRFAGRDFLFVRLGYHF
jgi:hypothetical protein